ncbi:Hypothetical predicted protein, partial [Paramuricea clavata]
MVVRMMQLFVTCQFDGSCLCSVDHEPNFRNPRKRAGDDKDYGCLNSESIRAGAVEEISSKFAREDNYFQSQLRGKNPGVEAYQSRQTKCIQAKVLGTWSTDAVSEPAKFSVSTESTATSSQPPTSTHMTTSKTTLSVITKVSVSTESTPTSSQPKSSHITTGTSSSVTVTTAEPTTTQPTDVSKPTEATLTSSEPKSSQIKTKSTSL